MQHVVGYFASVPIIDKCQNAFCKIREFSFEFRTLSEFVWVHSRDVLEEFEFRVTVSPD